MKLIWLLQLLIFSPKEHVLLFPYYKPCAYSLKLHESLFPHIFNVELEGQTGQCLLHNAWCI